MNSKWEILLESVIKENYLSKIKGRMDVVNGKELKLTFMNTMKYKYRVTGRQWSSNSNTGSLNVIYRELEINLLRATHYSKEKREMIFSFMLKWSPCWPFSARAQQSLIVMSNSSGG